MGTLTTLLNVPLDMGGGGFPPFDAAMASLILRRAGQRIIFPSFGARKELFSPPKHLFLAPAVAFQTSFH